MIVGRLRKRSYDPHFLSPKRFGAVGDGTADDTAAVSAAITAAGVGGVLYFESGTYAVTSITALANQTFTGNNARLVVSGTFTSASDVSFETGCFYDIENGTHSGDFIKFGRFNPNMFTAARYNAALAVAANRGRLYVSEFGAVSSDGTDDEATALQAACDAVSDSDRILDLEGGTWRFDSQLTLTDQCHVENGRLKPSITDTSDRETNSCIRIYQNNDTFCRPTLRDLVIERYNYQNKIALQVERSVGMRIDRIKFENWINNNTALRFLGVQGGRVDDVEVDGFGTYCLEIDGLTGYSRSTDITFYRCIFKDGRTTGNPLLYCPEFGTSGAGGASGITFDNCEFSDVVGPAVDAEMPRRMRFKNCRFETMTGDYDWILLKNTDNDNQVVLNSIESCSFEAPGGTSSTIDIGANVLSTRIINNKFSSTGTLLTDAGTDTRCSGNTYLGDKIGTQDVSITAAATTTTITAPLVKLSADGVYTMSGDGGTGYTFAAGEDGQEATLVNVGSNAITLQDNSNYTNGLRLASNNDVSLGVGDTIQIIYLSDYALWTQKASSVNT